MTALSMWYYLTLDIWYFQLRDESVIPKYLMNCFSNIAFLLISMVINLLMAYYMDEKLVLSILSDNQLTLCHI